MNSLEEIEKEIRATTTPDERIVSGIWGVDCLFNPCNNGRIFDCKFILAQTMGIGCAYSVNEDYPRNKLIEYIGKDFLSSGIDDIALKVSLFDSVYESVRQLKVSRRIQLSGSPNCKMHKRTEIILEEAERMVGSLEGKNVVNVGVVGDILISFSQKGARVVGTDFDPTIIETDAFADISVFDGTRTIDMIRKADLAVVTGMTITTQTIDEIIQVCNERNIPIIVFAETGANLASYYIRHGVNVYLSERFPFYIFSGESFIDVYRSDEIQVLFE